MNPKFLNFSLAYQTTKISNPAVEEFKINNAAAIAP
jgi:hypothetical protein